MEKKKEVLENKFLSWVWIILMCVVYPILCIISSKQIDGLTEFLALGLFLGAILMFILVIIEHIWKFILSLFTKK